MLCVLIRIASGDDSNETTQSIFMLKKNQQYIPILPPDLLCLTLTSSTTRLEHVSWFQRCSSHCTSAVSTLDIP